MRLARFDHDLISRLAGPGQCRQRARCPMVSHVSIGDQHVPMRGAPPGPPHGRATQALLRPRSRRSRPQSGGVTSMRRRVIRGMWRRAWRAATNGGGARSRAAGAALCALRGCRELRRNNRATMTVNVGNALWKCTNECRLTFAYPRQLRRAKRGTPARERAPQPDACGALRRTHEDQSFFPCAWFLSSCASNRTGSLPTTERSAAAAQQLTRTGDHATPHWTRIQSRSPPRTPSLPVRSTRLNRPWTPCPLHWPTSTPSGMNPPPSQPSKPLSQQPGR